MAKIAETPLMAQYAAMKKKHPDAVLLFRVGDFYETFSDDAITASEILGHSRIIICIINCSGFLVKLSGISSCSLIRRHSPAFKEHKNIFLRRGTSQTHEILILIS